MQQEEKVDKMSVVSWPYRTPPLTVRSPLSPTRWHQCDLTSTLLGEKNVANEALENNNGEPNDEEDKNEDDVDENGVKWSPKEERINLPTQEKDAECLFPSNECIQNGKSKVFSPPRECAGAEDLKKSPQCACSKNSMTSRLKSYSESPSTWSDNIRFILPSTDARFDVNSDLRSDPRIEIKHDTSFDLKEPMLDENTCCVDWDLPSSQLDVLFQQLSVPKCREITADLIVRIRSQSFRTHRFLLAHFSKYFFNILKQRHGKIFVEVVLRDISPESFAIIYEWMYTSQLSVTSQNLLDVLYTAQFLEIPEVIVHCMEFLNQTVTTPENLLMFYGQAFQLCRRGLMEHILRLLATVFCRIVAVPGFNNLDFDAMKFLLSCDNLNVNSEREVFEAAVSWLMYSLESRKQCVVELMSCVRFAHMTEAELFECLHNEHCQVIMSYSECRLMVLQGYLCHTSQSLGNLESYPHLSVPPRRSLWEQIHEGEVPTGDACHCQRRHSPIVQSPKCTSPVTYHLCDYANHINRFFNSPSSCWQSPQCIPPKMGCLYRQRTRHQEDVLGKQCLIEEVKRKRNCWPKWWAKDKDCKYADHFDFGVQCPAILQAECLARKLGPCSSPCKPFIDPCKPLAEPCRPLIEPLPTNRMSCGGCMQKHPCEKTPPCPAEITCPWRKPPWWSTCSLPQQTCKPEIRSSPCWKTFDETNKYKCPTEEKTFRWICKPLDESCRSKRPAEDEPSPSKRPMENESCQWECQLEVVPTDTCQNPADHTIICCECPDLPDEGHSTILLLGGLNPLDSWNCPNAGKLTFVYSTQCCYEKTLGSWKKYHQLPVPRHHAAAATLNGSVYLTGGCCPNRSRDGRTIEAISSVWRFHVKTMCWDKLSDMLHARIHHGFVAVNGSLVALGGQDETGKLLDSVERYSICDDKWEELAPLSTPRMGMGSSEFRNEIWVCGGMALKDKDKSPTITKLVECFDVKNNRWNVMNPLRFPRCFATLVEYNGLLHLVGGVTRVSAHKDCVISSVASIDVHEPCADEWSFKTALQVPRHNAAVAIFEQKLFVIGGITSLEACALDCVECYSDVKGGWEKGLPHLPLPLSGVSSVVVNIPNDY